ncbi:HutD family protein [Anaerophilus nitritogenes]|uniref:HutD family protein n=1 Tax=Anaerophilus nitritogenes TaxID=2498136 RepID=UPI00101C1865|nr:HutD family protein [Anaerophilus nitritogenes]
MSIKIIRAKEQKESLWSGGSTKEIYIYPQKTSYEERNFDIRISRAVVVDEKSTFTKLKEFDRKLMILDGSLEIQHTLPEGECIKNHLKPYEVTSFDGGWDTTSIGKVSDFNLMMKKGLKGDLKRLVVHENEKIQLQFHNKRLALLYCLNGVVEIYIQEETYNKQFLYDGDVLVIENANNQNIKDSIYFKKIDPKTQIINAYVF